MKLLTFLLEIYKEEYELNLKEGEIKTTPVGRTVDILNRKFKDHIRFRYDKEKNYFFATTTKETSISELNDLLRDSNNLGWFPSFIESKEYKGKYLKKYAEYYINDGTPISLHFEAKFDIAIDKYPKILYHITPTKNSTKIEKIGLSPRSKEKASSHPERVYLAKTEEDAEKLANQFKEKTGIKDYTIFSIDTGLIPGEYFRLYQDPNYRDGGYYTLNNIPPIALKKIKDIEVKPTFG